MSSLLVRFAPKSLTTKQYDEAVRRLEDAGYFPPQASTITCASAAMAV